MRILIVDDDELMRDFMLSTLSQDDYEIEEADSAEKALKLLGKKDFDIVISDIKMSGMSGIELFHKIYDLKPQIKWILITAYGSIEEAVSAIKKGAFDYLTKPLKNPDELREVVKKAASEIKMSEKIELLKEEIGKGLPPLEIIFCGRKMKEVFNLVKEVALTNATVLITGESGTGKELVARTIHSLSLRSKEPFVAVNCAALSESVLESELFGHEKGAFTGAIATRKGRFELADRGTIFLDEIGEISQPIQVKLLRVIQEKAIERVGSSNPIKVDIRIVSATNKDLKKEISEGRFREDLYYRLNVFPIHLPPLRERTDAIIPLAEYFIVKYGRELKKDVSRLSDEAKQSILEYKWEGNIRELQNVIERAVIISRGVIEKRHLNLNISADVEKRFKGSLSELEYDAIIDALKKTGGNKKKAAELLGISRRTLHSKINFYDIKDF